MEYKIRAKCLGLYTRDDEINDAKIEIGIDFVIDGSINKQDKSIKQWNLSNGTCVTTFSFHTDTVFCLKVLSHKTFASGSADNTTKLWDTTSGQLIRTLSNHTGAIQWSVDLLNSQTLVSGSRDQTIKLWNWSTGECLSTIQTPGSRIESLAVINFD